MVTSMNPMNRVIPLLAVTMLVLAACAPAAQPAQPAAKPAASNPSGITGKTAAASLIDASGKNVGTVTFAETAGGLRTIVRVVGFQPGKYLSAIHVGKDCNNSPTFAAAGDQFKGQMGNLEDFVVGASGSEIISTLNARLTVAPGPNSVVGHTVLIKTDRARVACGEIGSAE